MIAFTNIRRSYIIFSNIMIATLLYGCTTMHSIQDCSPKEKAQLSSKVSTLTARLNNRKSRLKATNIQLKKQACFTKRASSVCSQLNKQKIKLEDDIKTLDGTLQEIKKIVAGQPTAAAYVKQCSVNWIRGDSSRASSKVDKRIPTRKLTPALGKKTSVKDTYYLEPERIVVSPVTMPEPEQPEQKPAPALAAQPVPAPAPSAAPAPQIERVYTANPKVRVVGPVYLPDPVEPASQPVPAHAIAP